MVKSWCLCFITDCGEWSSLNVSTRRWACIVGEQVAAARVGGVRNLNGIRLQPMHLHFHDWNFVHSASSQDVYRTCSTVDFLLEKLRRVSFPPSELDLPRCEDRLRLRPDALQHILGAIRWLPADLARPLRTAPRVRAHKVELWQVCYQSQTRPRKKRETELTPP